MLTSDRVGGAALLLIGLFTLWESLLSARKLPLGTIRMPGPAYVPVVLATLLVLTGIAVLAMGARAPKFSSVSWSEWRHAVGILAACAFVALALERLGYRITMVLTVFGLLAGLERKGVVFGAVFALALGLGTFLLFETFLRVPLPRGVFGY